MEIKKFRLLIFLNIISYLATIATWISIPEVMIVNYILLGCSLCFTCVVIVLNRSQFKEIYTSRFFNNFVSAFISSVLVFFILGLLNYLAFKNPISFDVSKRGYHSLTGQTKQLLKRLERPLTFHVFAPKSSFAVIKQLTELYRLSYNNLTVEFHDAQLRPDLVKSYNVTKIPSMVMEYPHPDGARRSTISLFSEKEITTSLLKISRTKKITLYFTTGHGEVNLQAEQNDGASALTEMLNTNNYILKSLNLARASEIPSEADALIIWGPKTGFFSNEVDLLTKFYKKGGNVMIALDPSFKGKPVQELRDWIQARGLFITNNLVIDRLKFVNGSKGTIPFVHLYNTEHPISKDVSDQVFFPLVSGVEVVSDHKNSENWSVLAQSNTFPAAWGETSPEELIGFKMLYHDGIDIRGPLGYAAALETKDNRLVVYGNSSFVTNTYKKFANNILFAVNSFNWLTGEESLITFDTPAMIDKPIFIGQNQLGVIFYFSVVFLPLLLILFAFYLYRRRRVL
jgi:ABC-type uncharacterized transport system involved in gliding motility auxiliary subunit